MKNIQDQRLRSRANLQINDVKRRQARREEEELAETEEGGILENVVAQLPLNPRAFYGRAEGLAVLN